MTPSRTAKRWAITALVALGTATLIGCGPGGGGSGGGGGGQTAGIEGTGITSGFGSVYVGGIEFATDDADILFNGKRVGEQALRVGDVVRVSGDVDDNGQGRARRIVFTYNLKGPIKRIERQPDQRGELSVLGQRVRFDANTHFVDADEDTLKTGDLIAVSGFSDGNGALRATLIDNQGAYQPGTALAVEGRIADLRGDRFHIGDLSIQYTPANVADGGPLVEGDAVRVTGLQSAAAAPLTAQRIERSRRRLGGDGERVFVNGLVSDIDGDRFTVAGQRIDAAGAQRTGAVDAPLDGNASVSVSGVRRADVIAADTVRIESEPDVTLRARLDTIDGADNRVVLLGSEWTIEADTRYLDQTAQRERKLRLNRLAAGDTIQAVGYAGSNGLIMTRLDRIESDADGDSFLRGPVENVQRAGTVVTIGLAGTAITADTGRTRFENAAGQTIAASAFLSTIKPGIRISAEGPENGDRINVARTVRLLE